MAENRRVKMTKRLIKDAYVELTIEQPDHKPSVTDVCARADVNRSTFYTHYKDLDFLYEEIEQDFFDRVPVLVPESDPDYIPKNMALLEGFFSFVAANPDLFSIFLSANCERGWEFKLANILFQNFRPSGVSRDNCAEYYEYVFCVMGALGATKEWYKSGCPMPPDGFGRLIFESCQKALTDSLSLRMAMQQ